MGGYDSAVSLVDLTHGSFQLLGYHDHLVNFVTVSSDGRLGASCSSDYSTFIWDLGAGVPVCRLVGHDDDVEGFCFIDGATGVSVSRDHSLILWDVTTGTELRSFVGHEKDALSVAYHDGVLFSTSDDMTLRMWDVRTGVETGRWGPFKAEVDTCAVDRRKGRVVLGGDDGKVRIFNIADGLLVAELAAHSSGIKKVATEPDGSRFLSSAYDQRLLLWDGDTLEAPRDLPRSSSVWERSLTFSPDGSHILGGTFDGTVVAWSLASGTTHYTETRRSATDDGNFCPNDVAVWGERFAVVSDDGLIRLGRVSDGGLEITDVAVVPERVLMNAVALTAEVCVAGGHDQQLRIASHRDGELGSFKLVRVGEGPINSVVIGSHEGSPIIAVASYSGAVTTFTVAGERLVTFHPHDGAVKAVRLLPDGKRAASCSADGSIAVWDFAGDTVCRPGHDEIVNDLAVSPSGTLLASVARDFTVRIVGLDAATGLENSNAISLPHRSPKSVYFAEEDTLVIGDYWGYLVVVRLTDGAVNDTRIAGNGISAIGGDGDAIIAASYDGTLHRVGRDGAEVGAPLRLAEQRVAGAVLPDLFAGLPDLFMAAAEVAS